MRRYFIFAGLLSAIFLASQASAALSAKGAFILLDKVPPGEYLPDAREFLGRPASSRVMDKNLGVGVLRWGSSGDSWFLDVLHDADTVRATRVTWRTKSRGEQQAIFSQLTTAGKNFFGRPAAFRGLSEAEWNDFGGRWIVVARIESDVTRGVTLLSGIRDQAMGSDKFGF
ncbi:MAG: hypothetical protein LBR87_01160 [Synergistaceae bacterium]|jgi:hypothetical protein|nr:hypothetical protein [Synergistaceae bacterium]